MMKPSPPMTCGVQYMPSIRPGDMWLEMPGSAVKPAIQKIDAANLLTRSV